MRPTFSLLGSVPGLRLVRRQNCRLLSACPNPTCLHACIQPFTASSCLLYTLLESVSSAWGRMQVSQVFHARMRPFRRRPPPPRTLPHARVQKPRGEPVPPSLQSDVVAGRGDDQGYNRTRDGSGPEIAEEGSEQPPVPSPLASVTPPACQPGGAHHPHPWAPFDDRQLGEHMPQLHGHALPLEGAVRIGQLPGSACPVGQLPGSPHPVRRLSGSPCSSTESPVSLLSPGSVISNWGNDLNRDFEVRGDRGAMTRSVTLT